MTEAVSDEDLPPQAWLRPSPRFSSMRRAQVAAVTAASCLFVAVLILVALARGLHPQPAAVALVAGALLVAGLVGDFSLQRRVRAWAYCEREDDLLVRRGVLITRLSVVPYGRMQFIDVVAGPIERIYGLATVRMHTAAAASGARIPGLSAESAATLRDHLAALGESRATGL